MARAFTDGVDISARVDARIVNGEAQRIVQEEVAAVESGIERAQGSVAPDEHARAAAGDDNSAQAVNVQRLQTCAGGDGGRDDEVGCKPGRVVFCHRE
jgi:hypothetical protein